MHALGQLEAEVALHASQLVEGCRHGQFPLQPDGLLGFQLLEASGGLASEEDWKVREKEDGGDMSNVPINLIGNCRDCHIDIAEGTLLTEAPSTEDLQEILERRDLSATESQDHFLQAGRERANFF